MDDPIKNLYVLPARGNGKSMLQAQIYEELLKGESNMNFKMDWDAFMKRNFAAAGSDLDSQPETPNAGTIGVDLAEKEDNTVNIEPPKVEEEWVWVKGFKGTDRQMQCRNFQYEVGKQFFYEGNDSEIFLCHTGFHFCKELKNVFGWYHVGDGNRFFEVEALVRKKDANPDNTVMPIFNPFVNHTSLTGFNSDKLTSKAIRFVRELSVDEVFAALGGDTVNWSEDMKMRAMATSPETVRADIRIEELVAAGYSRTFAKYISRNADECETALAVASLPDVSMDVKVLSIFMENNH